MSKQHTKAAAGLSRRKFVAVSGAMLSMPTILRHTRAFAQEPVFKVGYSSALTGHHAATAEPDPFVLGELKAILGDGVENNGKRVHIEILNRDSASIYGGKNAEDLIFGDAAWLPAAARLRTQIASAEDSTDRGVESPDNAADVLDVTPLREAFGELDDDALAFLGEFIKSADAKVRTIINCMDDLEITRLIDVTHSLKGECLSFGGTKLGRLLQQFERDLRDTTDWTRRKPEIEREWTTPKETADRLIRGRANQKSPEERRNSASAI